MATKKDVKTTRKATPKPSMEVTSVVPKAAKPVPTAVTKPAAAPAPTPAAAPKATFDQIKARAYEVWLRKGCPSGQDVQNWEDAERELGVR